MLVPVLVLERLIRWFKLQIFRPKMSRLGGDKHRNAFRIEHEDEHEHDSDATTPLWVYRSNI